MYHFFSLIIIKYIESHTFNKHIVDNIMNDK